MASLQEHAVGKKHVTKLHLRLTNVSLPGSQRNKDCSLYGLHPNFQGVVEARSQSAKLPAPIIHVQDRVTNLEGMVLAFMAEKTLPFSIAPDLVKLMKEAAKDPHSSDLLTMGKSSASYKTRFGVADTYEEETLIEMRKNPFSLNIDESMSNNHKKILSVLVSYFSNEMEEVVVRHLISLELDIVNSSTLFKALCDVFEEKNIPWKNLISILMDSCAVMRGSKSGLEVKIRNGPAPHLLDVDGDSCHHFHNAAKKLCDQFDGSTERLFKDIHTDFQYSTEIRDVLSRLCLAISLKFTMPDNFIKWRWLSNYNVSVSTLRMWDAYILFYFAYLDNEDQALYKYLVTNIYEQRNVSTDAQALISQLHKQIAAKKKSMTEDGKKRKERITKALFYRRKDTKLVLNFYAFVLELFQKYVCWFQSKEPQIHKVNDKQLDVLTEFLSYFVKPEIIKSGSIAEIRQLDLKEEDLLPAREMLFGSANNKFIAKLSRSSSAVKEFQTAATKAYVECFRYMQKKIPLKNDFLRSASAIDPEARGHSTTLRLLKKLVVLVPNVLNSIGDFEKEVHRYQLDKQLPSPIDVNSNMPVRIDKWWKSIQKSGKYPALSTVALAVCTCFHGAIVESTFSIMNQVIDKGTGNMRTDTYSSIQTVKYYMQSKKKGAIELFSRKDIHHDPIDRNFLTNMRTSKKRYEAEKETKRVAKDEKMKALQVHTEELKTSKAKSKELLTLANKKSKQVHKQACLIRRKRKISAPLEVNKKRKLAENV